MTSTVCLTLVSLLYCLNLVCATTAEEKPEARMLDDNTLRHFVHNPLALSFGLLPSKTDKNSEKETVIISATSSTDKLQHMKPSGGANGGSLSLANSFLPNYPYMPMFGLSQTPTNAPVYTHRHEHYYNNPPILPSVSNELGSLRVSTLAALLKSLTSTPYVGLERSSYLNSGRYPSFVIINPAHFGPYIQSQYNREATPSSYGGFSRNSGANINAIQSLNSVEPDKPIEHSEASINPESDTLVDMKPIFMTESQMAGEEGILPEQLWEQARTNPQRNPLLELILKQNQRKQLHDEYASAYLRNYKAIKK